MHTLYPQTYRLFPMGQFAMSRGVADLLATGPAYAELEKAFARHAIGDWGDIHPGDVGANEAALEEGTRLMSVYTVAGVKIWIFTEADRSVTTAILPDEY